VATFTGLPDIFHGFGSLPIYVSMLNSLWEIYFTAGGEKNVAVENC
jgi:hypothetical protein